jgi:hypothetical protein
MSITLAPIVLLFSSALAASTGDEIAKATLDSSVCASTFHPGMDQASLIQLGFSKPVVTHDGSQQHPSVATLVSKAKADPLDGGAVVHSTSDWLFDFGGSTSCSDDVEPAWDNTAQSYESRVFMPFFLVFITCCVLSSGSVDTPEIRANTVMANRPRERRYELDFVRVICVAVVVIEHSGGKHWSRHNIVFGQQWVLPYLYITSAIAFMMSQKTTLAFNARLAVVLAVGVAANWMSDVLTGRDWQNDFGNTIFQMFYVVMLIMMSVVAGPLRHVLQYTEEKTSIALWGPTVLYGTITVFTLTIFAIGHTIAVTDGAGTWMLQAAPLLNNAPIAILEISGLLFLCHLACFGQANDVLAWVLLAFIYIPAILIPWPQIGFIHNLQVFVFAMVAESWKIRGYRTIQGMFRNYWPFLILALTIASVPDYYGRCDLMPPNTTWERVRFYSIEILLVLTLSSGALTFADPYGALEWLNYWALYAYCFHVCWARLFPVPYGFLFTFSSMILFYSIAKMRHGKGASERKGSPDLIST